MLLAGLGGPACVVPFGWLEVFGVRSVGWERADVVRAYTCGALTGLEVSYVEPPVCRTYECPLAAGRTAVNGSRGGG
ncbi:hypothetical protein [Kribbella sp. NPDC055071]